MPVCACGRMAVSRTIWMTTNPGRRLFMCPHPHNSRCFEFLGWKDPPMCLGSVEIIPDLLREKKLLEDEVIPNLVRVKEIEEANTRKIRIKLIKRNTMIKIMLLVIAMLLLIIVVLLF